MFTVSLNHAIKKLQLTQKISKRLFNFASFDCIGFDLDHTLAVYNFDNLVKMEYYAMTKYLSKRMPELQKHITREIDMEFIQKGLFLDVEKGNILQLDACGNILTAYHGTKVLENGEILRYYPEMKSEHTVAYSKDPLAMWNAKFANIFRPILDHFDAPVALIFANAIDSMDKTENAPKYTFYAEMIKEISNMYVDFYGGSPIYKELREDSQRYYYKCTGDLLEWLKMLKSCGKVIFCATGACSNFADYTASYAMGQNWKELFDVVVYYARKPHFFYLNRPFRDVDSNKDVRINKRQKEYNQGNMHDLKCHLEGLCGKKDPNIVYLGDNIIADVCGAYSVGVKSVAVCAELTYEPYYYLDDIKVEKMCKTSKYFGTIYRTASGDETIWLDILRKKSLLQLPLLNYVAKYPIDFEFRSRILQK